MQPASRVLAGVALISVDGHVTDAVHVEPPYPQHS